MCKHIYIYIYIYVVYEPHNHTKKSKIDKYRKKLRAKISCQLYFNKRKKKEVLTHATTWMNLENIVLSQRSQTQKTTYYMVSFV